MEANFQQQRMSWTPPSDIRLAHVSVGGGVEADVARVVWQREVDCPGAEGRLGGREEVNCSSCTLIIDWIRNKETVTSWLCNFLPNRPLHNQSSHLGQSLFPLPLVSISKWKDRRRGRTRKLLPKDLFEESRRRTPLVLMNILVLSIIIMLSPSQILSGEERGEVSEEYQLNLLYHVTDRQDFQERPVTVNRNYRKFAVVR